LAGSTDKWKGLVASTLCSDFFTQLKDTWCGKIPSTPDFNYEFPSSFELKTVPHPPQPEPYGFVTGGVIRYDNDSLVSARPAPNSIHVGDWGGIPILVDDSIEEPEENNGPTWS